MKFAAKILLVLILILASAVRVYQLDRIPPSISWDEAAVGYNGYSIANWGRDEYGKIFPLFFQSFGDDKHPVHVYTTAISVKILGLNEFSTRIPSALFGVLNVLLIYFLAKTIFKEDLIGIAAAAFLAISPYNIHFSRFNHEANFTVFFYMLGLLLFYLSFTKGKIWLPLSVFSFSLSFLSYHPAKVLVPVTVLLLLGVYFKEVLKNKAGLFISVVILISLGWLVYLNPQLLGLARINQNTLNEDQIKTTYLYKLTRSQLFGKLNLIAIQYSWHFSPEFLFITGDKNPRLSAQKGQFYWFDLPFILAGFLFLLYRRSKEGLVLIVWLLASPLPSSLAAEAPHAARASFMMGSWYLISALGIYFLIRLIRGSVFRWGVILVSIIILSISLFNFLKYYFGEYATRYAIEWQYGMRQIVEYVKDHPEYGEVYMTEVRSQPYIFFLYYLKTPLPEYLKTVLFNSAESKSYNSVSNFSRYYFGGWDKAQSFPQKGILYIVTPSEYDGLSHRNEFEVKRLIKYPNGSSAFYLVTSE